MAINVIGRVFNDNPGVQDNFVNEGDGWADTFYMTPEAFILDTVNGGGGIDTVDYSKSQIGVQITLTDPTQKAGTSGGYVEADFTGTFYSSDGSVQSFTMHRTTETLKSIENATGSNFNDVLKGNGSANVLKGLGGNDIIDAGGGSDTIIGGAGHDTMTGGLGNDKFVFEHASDGPMSAATYYDMDTITDFVRGEDKIDLHALVAETAGHHALSYIDGGAFTGVAGQVNSVFTGYGWLVKADLDGDRSADFQVLVHSTTDIEMHQHLQASDFILV
jgi:Ca2+-binding RTX toxin-like protein